MSAEPPAVQTVAERIRAVFSLAPERWAVEAADKRFTWCDLGQAADTMRDLLDTGGIGRDDAVGIVGRNLPELVAGFLAVLAAERGLVLINGWRAAAAIREETESLRLACLVATRADWTPEMAAWAAARGMMAVAAEVRGGDLAFDLVSSRTAAGPFHQRPAGALLEIQTSGTTGAPKRIAIAERTMQTSLRNAVWNAAGQTDASALEPKTSPTLMFGPLVHTSGTLGILMSVFEARPIVLFDKFTTAAYRAKLARHRPKFVALPPTALRMMLESDATAEELSSLIAVRCGTQALPIETQDAFETRFGVPVLTNYGATEFMGTVAGWTLADHKTHARAKRGSVGRANRGMELQVVDLATGAPCPPDTAGTLEVKAARFGASWVRTSDLARIDEDGFLFVLGRTDDAIVRGGFKILAGKVADVLRLHPSVSDVIVVGVPDPRLGQVPVAVVERRPGATPPTEENLIAFARERLLPYETPVRCLIVDRLPRTVSDKVSRVDVLSLIEDATAVARNL